MEFFFSFQLEDIAISPPHFNPSLNNVECVVEDGSNNRFESVKKTFPQICWMFWLFSLIGSYFVNVLCIQLFNENYDNSEDAVVKATFFFLFIVFCLGVISAIAAICYSTEGIQVVYPLVFLVSIALVYLRGLFYCRTNLKDDALVSPSTPHTLSPYTVDPGCFIVVHYVLWMMIGMITEPFWAIPVVTSCAIVIFLFYISAFFYLSVDRRWDVRDKVHLAVLVFAVLSTLSVQFSFFLVGSHFFNEGLVSGIIPSVLVMILSIWCKFFKDYDRTETTPDQRRIKSQDEAMIPMHNKDR